MICKQNKTCISAFLIFLPTGTTHTLHLRIASSVVMQSSQSLKILLDMLREDLRTKLNSSIGGMPNTGGAVDDSISHAIETLREGLLDKFELVAKADHEAQVALLENMRAQLKDLEERLAALEQTQAS